MIPSRRRNEPGTLIEREEALAAVEAALGAARDGRGETVIFSGPPGIGKTRVLDVAVGMAREAGFRTVRAQGAESEAGFAFAGVLQLLEREVGFGAGDPSLLTGSAALAGPVLEGRFLDGGGGSLASAIHGLFWVTVNLATSQPLALLVDDLHALDEPTLAYLLYLHRRIDNLPVALIAATRPPELLGRPALSELVLAPNVEERPLRPLSEEGVAALVRAEFDADADEDFCAACRRVSGGNPFYLGEALRELAAEGTPGNRQGARRLSDVEPQALTRAVLLRLARLGSSALALARAAAVLGSGSPISTAAELAELPLAAALEAADTLAGAMIVATPDPLTFTHALVAAAIAADLAPGQSRAMHLRAAELLLARAAPVERVAGHLLHAPPAGRREFVEALAAAASHAQQTGAPATAAAFLRRALEEHAFDAERRVELLLALGRAELANDPTAAAARLQEARALGVDALPASQLALELGRALYVAGEHERAARTFLDAAEQLPDGDAMRAELLAWFASASIFVESLRPQALELVAGLTLNPPSEPTPGERAVLARAAVDVVTLGGPLREVREVAEAAWGGGALLEAETSDGYSWMHLTAVNLWGGDYLAAERITELALSDARRRGSVMAFATASYIKASAELFQGRLLDSLADIEQTLEVHSRYGWSMFLGAAVATHAQALLERGESEEAAAALRAAGEDDRFDGSGEGAMLRLTRGLLLLAEDRPQEALEALRSAQELAERLSLRVVRLLPVWVPLAQALARLGQADQALSELAEGEAAARRAELGDVLAAVLVTRAGLEQGETALATLEAAVEAAAASQSRLELARAQAALGGQLRRGGRRNDATAPLRAAVELARPLGAARIEAFATEELAVLGARPQRDHARSGVMALTASELRTARLAAEGMTNREIAESLFVTPKTVEYHLRNAFMKLDVTSRRELHRRLDAEGSP